MEWDFDMLRNASQTIAILDNGKVEMIKDVQLSN